MYNVMISKFEIFGKIFEIDGKNSWILNQCEMQKIEINEYKCFMITLAKSSCDNDCDLRGTCHPILQFKCRISC